jgi:hypothetical protein
MKSDIMQKNKKDENCEEKMKESDTIPKSKEDENHENMMFIKFVAVFVGFVVFCALFVCAEDWISRDLTGCMKIWYGSIESHENDRSPFHKLFSVSTSKNYNIEGLGPLIPGWNLTASIHLHPSQFVDDCSYEFSCSAAEDTTLGCSRVVSKGGIIAESVYCVARVRDNMPCSHTPMAKTIFVNGNGGPNQIDCADGKLSDISCRVAVLSESCVVDGIVALDIAALDYGDWTARCTKFRHPMG